MFTLYGIDHPNLNMIAFCLFTSSDILILVSMSSKLGQKSVPKRIQKHLALYYTKLQPLEYLLKYVYEILN